MQMLCDDDDGVHIRTPRSRRDADAPYPKSGLTFNLHFCSNTITLFFNFLAIISREDEV